MKIDKSEFEIVNSLVYSTLKHNYFLFVDKFGYEDADIRLEQLFGQTWLSVRETIWQEYDREVFGVTYES